MRSPVMEAVHVAQPSETTSLLPRTSYHELPHQHLPALMPYVHSLPPGRPPSFDEIKYLDLPDSSSSVRVAFGLLVLLHLLCAPEPKMPYFQNAWDEWEERKRRQLSRANLETSLLNFWRDFEEDDCDKDLEEILFTEFTVEGDADKVVRGMGRI